MASIQKSRGVLILKISRIAASMSRRCCFGISPMGSTPGIATLDKGVVDAVVEAVDNVLDNALNDAVDDAVYDAVDEAVDDAVDQAVDNAVVEAVGAMVD